MIFKIVGFFFVAYQKLWIEVYDIVSAGIKRGMDWRESSRARDQEKGDLFFPLFQKVEVKW